MFPGMAQTRRAQTGGHGLARMRRYIGMLAKFFGMLVGLLRDSRVSVTDKAILGVTVAYVLNPVDLVPDWVPFFGLVEDVYLVGLAVLRLVLRADPNVSDGSQTHLSNKTSLWFLINEICKAYAMEDIQPVVFIGFLAYKRWGYSQADVAKMTHLCDE